MVLEAKSYCSCGFCGFKIKHIELLDIVGSTIYRFTQNSMDNLLCDVADLRSIWHPQIAEQLLYSNCCRGRPFKKKDVIRRKSSHIFLKYNTSSLKNHVFFHIPSGNLLHGYWKWSMEILSFPPKKWWIFPVCYVNICQRVNLHFPIVFAWFSDMFSHFPIGFPRVFPFS